MGELEIGFHGICTHFNDVNRSEPLNRVVLLECPESSINDQHRALLSVPPSVMVEVKGDADCKCIERATVKDPHHPNDRH